MTMAAPDARQSAGIFSHEALFYAGDSDFVVRTTPFIREGVAAGEPVLVVVGAAKIERLRAELGSDASAVRFADMADVGSNPARIIPAWKEFVSEFAAGGYPARGIGEPIWAARSPDELVECERHEALLNVAFSEGVPWRLLCPYDVTTLDPAVLEEAGRNHRFVRANQWFSESALYRDVPEAAKPFDKPLREPDVPVHHLAFDVSNLEAVRAFVAAAALDSRMTGQRTDDIVLAVNEIATNSIRHGGGNGVLRSWRASGKLIFEIRDDGRIEQPLAGRERPVPDQEGGYGLWLANQLCDLVQIRTFGDGSVVRLHMAR